MHSHQAEAIENESDHFYNSRGTDSHSCSTGYRRRRDQTQQERVLETVAQVGANVWVATILGMVGRQIVAPVIDARGRECASRGWLVALSS
jgi:hypothetical protein